MARILSRRDLELVLKIDEVIDVVDQAFAHLDRGQAAVPVRTAVEVGEHDGLLLVMPGYLSEMGALGVKMVTVYPNNPARYAMPNVLGILVLIDCKTGEPVCVMDAAYLTAIRTGAVCAVATRYLARQDARSLGMVGTGAQAGGIATAICRVRGIHSIKAYSLEPQDRRARFARAVEEKTGVPVTLVRSAEEAVRGSDIVALATSSPSPVISGSWLAPGTHVNAIGNHHPDSREVDSDTVKKSIVVCDDIATCMQEAGDIILPIKNGEIPPHHVRYSLPEVVAGRGPARGADDITLFKSVGLSIQDVSTALYAYRKAVASGIGVEVDLT